MISAATKENNQFRCSERSLVSISKRNGVASPLSKQFCRRCIQLDWLNTIVMIGSVGIIDSLPSEKRVGPDCLGTRWR